VAREEPPASADLLGASSLAAGVRGTGQRRVEQIMGTAIGIDVRDAGVPPSALDEAFAYLRDIDARFSLYRADSEMSRLARGELALDVASADLRQVLVLCDAIRDASGGAFDAGRHRRDGLLDPTGLVKGWALEEAAWRIDAAGGRNFAVNGGGDILVRGEEAPGQPWRIGIRHPRQRDRVAAVLALREGAVATSAAYERGEHILDPRTGLAPREVVSMTVVGPSLTYADAYATAAFVMGLAGLEWVGSRPGYGAYAITADDRVTWTDVVDRLLA
jgi:thiamine biosynthesis lipoprotein